MMMMKQQAQELSARSAASGATFESRRDRKHIFELFHIAFVTGEISFSYPGKLYSPSSALS